MTSYAAGADTTPLLEETIGHNFERTASAHPDVEALVDVPSGRRWTYAELDAEIDVVARALMASGIRQGDRVGIWAPNCAEWTILQYATAKVGAILVTINPAYRTHELAYVLQHSGARLLISATEFKASDYRSMVAEVRPDVARPGRGGVPGFRGLGAAAPARRPRHRRRTAATDGRSDAARIPSTSNTPRAQRVRPRVLCCPTATSSTTGSS